MNKFSAVLAFATGSCFASAKHTATTHNTPAEGSLQFVQTEAFRRLNPDDLLRDLKKDKKDKRAEEAKTWSATKEKVASPHKGIKPLMHSANGQR